MRFDFNEWLKERTKKKLEETKFLFLFQYVATSHNVHRCLLFLLLCPYCIAYSHFQGQTSFEWNLFNAIIVYTSAARFPIYRRMFRSRLIEWNLFDLVLLRHIDRSRFSLSSCLMGMIPSTISRHARHQFDVLLSFLFLLCLIERPSNFRTSYLHLFIFFSNT